MAVNFRADPRSAARVMAEEQVSLEKGKKS